MCSRFTVPVYLQHYLWMSFLLLVSCLNGSDETHVEGKRLMPAGTQCPDATNHYTLPFLPIRPSVFLLLLFGVALWTSWCSASSGSGFTSSCIDVDSTLQTILTEPKLNSRLQLARAIARDANIVTTFRMTGCNLSGADVASRCSRR